MTRVLIAGCGYVGGELARTLAERDRAEVFALRRSASTLPTPIVSIASDLTGDERLATKLPDALDAVVYTVAADEHTQDAYERAYVHGLERLLAALSEKPMPPRRLIFVSSTAVYGQNAGEWVDETSPTEPAEFSGRTLLRAEEIASEFRGDSAVVRFGGIYGPARTRFVTSVRDGALRLAAGAEYTNRIHVSDCALVLRHLLQRPAIEAIYNGVDDDPADRAVVAEWLAGELGVPPPHRAEASGTRSSEATPHGKRCSNRRLRASGYDFRFPTFREGYANVIATL